MYCSRTVHGTYNYFIQKKKLKINLTLLLIYLKIILLQYFQFSAEQVVYKRSQKFLSFFIYCIFFYCYFISASFSSVREYSWAISSYFALKICVECTTHTCYSKCTEWQNINFYIHIGSNPKKKRILHVHVYCNCFIQSLQTNKIYKLVFVLYN